MGRAMGAVAGFSARRHPGGRHCAGYGCARGHHGVVGRSSAMAD